jgi:hypothetical protein
MRRFVGGILVSLGLVLGLTTLVPTAQAAAESRLAAAGIDASELKPGWVLDGENVIWGGGDAILSFGAAAASNACASGYLCLYDNSSFDDQNKDGVPDGEMIVRLRGTGQHYMSWYNFDNKMSSWKNYMADGVLYFFDAPGGALADGCWPSGQSSYHVGQWANDRVSAIYIFGPTGDCG